MASNYSAHDPECIRAENVLGTIYIPPGVYAQHIEGSCIHQSNENENINTDTVVTY